MLSTSTEKITGRSLIDPALFEPAEGIGIAATVAVIEASGYAVDSELWSMSADCSEGSGGDGSDTSGSGNCAQCHRGCHSS
ncbi:hypothetical protein [Kitasatospora purpeofusca]|uniref:Uncharacterized protein n=1 Tax=Kitasatospora purpeofusca TaxID=67352 RepID=A0ABZ1TVA4_9ACTN|nr:hypothetical protein [Kitasatospora purpeofusca]